ncbi:unnamed protein product [Pieris macdunnoughi]|uniref:DUF753 domain-containing protein n=1 Tax=Pieris macdunnoughi TaxID=345717 RepID=A0A821WSJ3_9NEOP|nr:unnamed protein product [Pieris macdunnoughi]
MCTPIRLWQIPKTKGDSYSAAYEDPEDHHNYSKGQGKTIHSLKGHYKEEAHRLMKCGSVDKKEKHIHVTDKTPQTEVNVATTQIENSSTNEILTTTENLRQDPTTTANAVETEESKTGQKSSNETKETTITPEYFVTLFLPASEKLGVINDTSLNDIRTPELNMEYLPETLLHLRRALEEEPINNINNETSSHSAAQDNHDTILDSTHKNFEFETLIIKNEAERKISNRPHQFLDQNKDADSNEENDGITMPSNLNDEQFPINYNNPFADQPPMRYAAPINPNVLNVQGNNSNNLSQSNPISNNPIEDSLAVDGKTFNSSENKASNRIAEINESDIDFPFNDPHITVEDLNRLASHPTKGFGVSEIYKSNFMLIEHPRVCFACSSTNNPSCWLPDMSTPAKYCRGDQDACVTKTYQHRGYAFVVRDCAASCVNRDLSEIGLLYKTCTICHSDLCNGANFTSFSLKTIILLLISIWFKYK